MPSLPRFKPVPCLSCGKDIIPTSKTVRKFCDRKCSNDFYCQKLAATDIKIGQISQCLLCGKDFAMKGAGQKYCSAACREENAFVDVRNTFRIFERDFFRCIYCGKSSIEDGVKLHADHIIPKIKGGQDVASNIVTSCKTCNLSKSDMMLKPILIYRLLELVKQRNEASKLHPLTAIDF